MTIYSEINNISYQDRQELSPSPLPLPMEASRVVNWFKMVRIHAKSYSREDQDALKRLAENAPIENEIPAWDCKPPILALIQQVKNAVASSRAFTEEQSGKLIEILNSLAKIYPTLSITPEPPASDRIRSPISFFSKEIQFPTPLSCNHLYRAQEGFVNLDSARQSQIEALHSERGVASLSEKSDEEDRCSKVAASPNSQNPMECSIAQLSTVLAHPSAQRAHPMDEV